MGSSGSSAGSLRRSSQSSRTGFGGGDCCADAGCAEAASGTAAAALPRRAINSRLFIVASLTFATGFALVLRRRTAQWLFRPRAFGMRHLHPAVEATPLVDVRKGGP